MQTVLYIVGVFLSLGTGSSMSSEIHITHGQLSHMFRYELPEGCTHY